MDNSPVELLLENEEVKKIEEIEEIEEISIEENSKSETKVLRSILKKDGGRKVEERGRNIAYSNELEYYGEARAGRVKEWKKNYKPCIIARHLRVHQRFSSFNPHFWKFPKSKYRTKYNMRIRLAVIEISLQNGLGGRYHIMPAPHKSFDFPLRCIALVLFGSPCCKRRLRLEACNHIINNWDHYKWTLKDAYSFNVEFFRNYDPEDDVESIHHYAKYLYKSIIYQTLFECKRLEIGVACELYETNFYCLENYEEDYFTVVPSETDFDKSVYFFAKQIPYSGKFDDNEIKYYKDYLLIWLKPIIRSSHNLIMEICRLRVTFSNPDIGYFHLFEEDPDDLILVFDVTNTKKRPRHHRVTYSPVVFCLYYYQKTSLNFWDICMRCLGYWLEPDVDDRLNSYNCLMIDRFHYLEHNFIKMNERTFFDVRLKPNQIEATSIHVENFIVDLKNRTLKRIFPKAYYAPKMRQMYIDKTRTTYNRHVVRNLKAEARNPRPEPRKLQYRPIRLNKRRKKSKK